MQGILSKRKRIIHRYFDELNQSYVNAHNKDWKDLNIRGKNLDKLNCLEDNRVNDFEFYLKHLV